MASVSDETSPTQDNEVDSLPSESKLSLDNEQIDELSSTKVNEDKQEVEPSTSTSDEFKQELQTNVLPETTSDRIKEEISTSISSKNIKKESFDSKCQDYEPTTPKSRSVKFGSSNDDSNVPKIRSSSSTTSRTSYTKSSQKPKHDFIDALVDSYKLETSSTLPKQEEKKYVPKTNRSRINPNWREHRTRRLMNKLEELSLWDREEEMKASQAQYLRDQKWEQIQDRQRNHDLCLSLMRQRHESEMESAVTLDRAATGVNDENTNATIARTMNLAQSINSTSPDVLVPPPALKRRMKQEQEKTTELKTPIGRYRQFETNMNSKIEKINQKLKPDHEIMRAYSPYRTTIPATSVPLFSETYSSLLSAPDTNSTNKYNQYHYGVASHLHAPSPDFDTRHRSYSNRDTRVPLKEQANDYSYYDDKSIDDYSRSSQIDDDYYPKYRSNSIDTNYYTKYRSNPIVDDDYYPKRRLNPIDEDYHSKHRLNPLDDDYYPKHRLNPLDDDYYPKHRLNPIDDDYYPKHRSHPVDEDDDYLSRYRSTVASRLDYSPPRRTTSLVSPTAAALYDFSTVANTPREFSLIHSRQPASSSIHTRSLNDDLNAITRYSTDTSKKILHNIGDSQNDLPTKTRSSSSLSTTKRVTFHDRDLDDDDENYSLSSNYSSRTSHRPVEILSHSSTR